MQINHRASLWIVQILVSMDVCSAITEYFIYNDPLQSLAITMESRIRDAFTIRATDFMQLYFTSWILTILAVVGTVSFVRGFARNKLVRLILPLIAGILIFLVRPVVLGAYPPPLRLWPVWETTGIITGILAARFPSASTLSLVGVMFSWVIWYSLPMLFASAGFVGSSCVSGYGSSLAWAFYMTAFHRQTSIARALVEWPRPIEK